MVATVASTFSLKCILRFGCVGRRAASAPMAAVRHVSPAGAGRERHWRAVQTTSVGFVRPPKGCCQAGAGAGGAGGTRARRAAARWCVSVPECPCPRGCSGPAGSPPSVQVTPGASHVRKNGDGILGSRDGVRRVRGWPCRARRPSTGIAGAAAHGWRLGARVLIWHVPTGHSEAGRSRLASFRRGTWRISARFAF